MYQPSHIFETFEEIKKSTFTAKVFPVFSEEEALETIKQNRDPKARHNCWAFRIKNIYRCTDDGEPSNTAGKPILNAIESNEIDNVLILVTRYFGGIKLGTGGLIRAYSGISIKSLQKMSKTEIIQKATVTITVPFEMLNKIFHLFTSFSIQKIDEKFDESGCHLCLKMPEKNIDSFKKKAIESCQGKLIFL